MSNKEDIELPLLSKGKAITSTAKGKGTSGHIGIDAPRQKPIHKSHFIEYLDASTPPDKYSPPAPFFQRLNFVDMLPHIRRMNNLFQSFEVKDIPNPVKSFNVEAKVIELDYHWMKECKKGKPDFSKALYQTFFREICISLFLIFIDCTTKIYHSIYMGKIINIITVADFEGEFNSRELIYAATLLTLLVILALFAKNWAFFTIVSNIGKARLTISSLLYKKLNSASLTSLHEINLGKVINLIGNDLNDMQGLNMVPPMLMSPYMIALGTYMMWGYFGSACLLGLISLIGMLFLQVYLSNLTEAPRKENKKTTDERVKFTHEIIEGIRLIKMYAWEELFQQRIESLRQKEYMSFIKMLRIDSIGRNFSIISVYLNILIVCIFYTAWDGILTPEKVYASMMILMYLSSALLSSHSGRMSLVNFRMITKRVQDLLTIKDVLLLGETSNENRSSLEIDGHLGPKPIVFENFTGYWSENAQKPCLSNINLTFKPGTLTAVIGKIGSGKTSLLLSFLRELPITRGTLSYSSKIAYVEQDPIIFPGTFRDNVLFGREFDETLYRQVLRDCNLDKDLETFQHGDQTRIGERGVNLSGGQKARVSLARALYSQSDIYLLDDPFSALDSKVARNVFNNVLKGSFHKDKIIILVTHHLHFARDSDHVVLMNEGRVEAEGSFKELERMNIGLLNVFKFEEERRMSMNTSQQKEEEEKMDGDKTASKTQEKASKEEAAQVSWETYKNYFKFKGSTATFIILVLLFLIPEGLMIYFTRLMGYWALEQSAFENDTERSSGDSFNNNYYIILCIVLLTIIFTINYTKTVKVNEFMLANNTKLHQAMLNAVVRAKILFFDLNPVGRILNRFSNDLGVLDKNNLKMAFEFLDNAIGHIGVLVTVCVINPAIFVPALLLSFGLYHIKKFFDKPMILTKKLELASKSPLISFVPVTLQGLVQIRIYNQGGRFVRDFINMVYDNAKTFIFLTKTTRLFAFALEAPIQLLSLSGIWLFIILMFYYHFEAGLLGLSLMYLLKMVDQGSYIIRQSLYIDINMQSAQRMLDYCHIKSEAPDYIPDQDAQVPSQWPMKGEITLHKVFLRYREDLEFALNGLSLNVPGGLKIACVGRTGAGKSSIIQALFRMVAIETGPNYPDSFIKIDGVDIHSIGLHLLRSKLSIIPQVPVIFAGTIKRNIDPFGKLSDNELWKVLEEVGLKDYVSSLQNKLDTDMTVSNNVFSAGQKQLICLARIIISKSKIIILDEATANVDVDTDSFIQKTIMTKFKDCTVLTIAHRLITIANYDRIVVIDNGRVVEYDTPYSLVVQRIGDTQITRRDGVFVEMVRSTGSSMAKKIFEIAREHYFASATTESPLI